MQINSTERNIDLKMTMTQNNIKQQTENKHSRNCTKITNLRRYTPVAEKNSINTVDI